MNLCVCLLVCLRVAIARRVGGKHSSRDVLVPMHALGPYVRVFRRPQILTKLRGLVGDHMTTVCLAYLFFVIGSGKLFCSDCPIIPPAPCQNHSSTLVAHLLHACRTGLCSCRSWLRLVFEVGHYDPSDFGGTTTFGRCVCVWRGLLSRKGFASLSSLTGFGR